MDDEDDKIFGRSQKFWIIWVITLIAMTGIGALLGSTVNKTLLFAITYLFCGAGFLFVSLRTDIEQATRRVILNVLLVILVFFPLVSVIAFPR